MLPAVGRRPRCRPSQTAAIWRRSLAIRRHPNEESRSPNIYIRADGARLAVLVAALADGLLSLDVGATFPLADAATALQGAVTGKAAGATVLTLEDISSDAVDHK